MPGGNNKPSAVSASASDYATATHAAAVLTYAADATRGHAISGIAWSYSGGTPTGSIKVEDGSGTTVFSQDIVAAGQDKVNFNPPKVGTANTALIVTLADGGVSLVGKVNVLGHWLEG